MTTKSEPYYWVVCNLCGVRHDYGEYTAWGDESQASDAADDSDWFVEHGDGLDYHICLDCLPPRDYEDEEDDDELQPQHGAEGHHCYESGMSRLFRAVGMPLLDQSVDVFCPFSDTGACPGGCPNNKERACVNGEPS